MHRFWVLDRSMAVLIEWVRLRPTWVQFRRRPQSWHCGFDLHNADDPPHKAEEVCAESRCLEPLQIYYVSVRERAKPMP